MTSHEYLKWLRDLLTLVDPQHIKWEDVKTQMDKVIAENEPKAEKKKRKGGDIGTRTRKMFTSGMTE